MAWYACSHNHLRFETQVTLMKSQLSIYKTSPNFVIKQMYYFSNRIVKKKKYQQPSAVYYYKGPGKDAHKIKTIHLA